MKYSVYVAVGVALAVLSGCGSSVPAGASDHSGPVTETKTVGWAGYAAEYRATGKTLVMPSGVVFPSSPPMSAASSGNFEKGLGVTDAVIAWNCAWGHAYLNASDGSKAKDHALKMFAKIKDTTPWRVAFDERSREFTSDAIEAARLGDVSELTNVLDGQCPR